MQYPLQERIGNPDLFACREKEFQNTEKWLDFIPKKLSKSRIILARRKSRKTAFVQRIFNRLWNANGDVIPFYFEIKESKILNIIEVKQRICLQRENDKRMELDVVAESDCGRMVVVEVKKRKTPVGKNVVEDFVDKLAVYAKQIPDNTILPVFLALGGFRKDARQLCEKHGIGTAERIAYF